MRTKKSLSSARLREAQKPADRIHEMWKYYVKICLIYDETVEKWLDDDVTAQKKVYESSCSLFTSIHLEIKYLNRRRQKMLDRGLLRGWWSSSLVLLKNFFNFEVIYALKLGDHFLKYLNVVILRLNFR